jgi:dephospho-CoA kinase
MVKIGITGGIGAGKSLVCKIFQCLGIQVYNADLKAKAIMNNNVVINEMLENAFGKSIFSKEGLNRHLLADLVFKDPKKLESLNGIVHPFVRTDFDFWANEQSSQYVIIESAILFESNFHKGLDATIEIYAPLEVRAQRSVARGGIIANEVIKRMENQMNEEEKKQMADYVIYNDDTQLLIPQVLKLHNQFITQTL